MRDTLAQALSVDPVKPLMSETTSWPRTSGRVALILVCLLSQGSRLTARQTGWPQLPSAGERIELNEDLERWRALIASYRQGGLDAVRRALEEWPPDRVERNARWAETINQRRAVAEKLRIPVNRAEELPPEVTAADLAAAAVMFLDAAVSEVDTGAYDRAPSQLAAGLAYLDLYDGWKRLTDPPLRVGWYGAAGSLMLAAVDVEGFEAHLSRIKAAGDDAWLWLIRGVYAELRGSPQLAHLLRPLEARSRESQRIAAARQQSLVDEAESCYRKSVEIDPDLTEGRLRLALLLSRQDRPKEAAAALGAMPAADDDADLRYLLLLASATIHAQAGEDDAALAAYRTAIELRPRAQSARVGLSSVLFRRGRVDEAFEALAPHLSGGSGAADADAWWSFQRGPYWRISPIMEALRQVVRQ